MERIVLTREQIDALVGHAKSEMPNEACAILFGTGETVSDVFLARNADESPAEFTIPDEQLIEAYGMAESAGVDVIGIFHSHPDSEAVPSETDRRFMQVNPVAWVIYSGATGQMRGYVLDPDISEIAVERA